MAIAKIFHRKSRNKKLPPDGTIMRTPWLKSDRALLKEQPSTEYVKIGSAYTDSHGKIMVKLYDPFLNKPLGSIEFNKLRKDDKNKRLNLSVYEIFHKAALHKQIHEGQKLYIQLRAPYKNPDGTVGYIKRPMEVSMKWKNGVPQFTYRDPANPDAKNPKFNGSNFMEKPPKGSKLIASQMAINWEISSKRDIERYMIFTALNYPERMRPDILETYLEKAKKHNLTIDGEVIKLGCLHKGPQTAQDKLTQGTASTRPVTYTNEAIPYSLDITPSGTTKGTVLSIINSEDPEQQLLSKASAGHSNGGSARETGLGEERGYGITRNQDPFDEHAHPYSASTHLGITENNPFSPILAERAKGASNKDIATYMRATGTTLKNRIQKTRMGSDKPDTDPPTPSSPSATNGTPITEMNDTMEIAPELYLPLSA